MADETKPKVKPKVPEDADDKEQSERFIETAREIDADESGAALEGAMKIISEIKGQTKK
ncbi:MAG: hypothetical protein NXI02_32155 [Rhodobacteraceae bacterium]|nr:hypothetical protein [Paracoccaceae bacterium]